METTNRRQTVDELRDELAGIGARIERAAAEEDAVGWMELRMRADALPRLIRDARLRPLEERLRRLDGELEALADERERVMTSEPPEPPASSHGAITKPMMRQRLLEGIHRRERSAIRERRETLDAIAAIEGGEGA